eukprot:TRINITY_DN9848_c0_g1_i1.p1 TRINITY_DN9848_c0_g1~~TRINITY_DN9848_c0_g1_i1.p1  ORF type:complete len:358 (+),score=25.19 TRINITY_DN9848_c0_g1_i1:50-1075(+)
MATKMDPSKIVVDEQHIIRRRDDEQLITLENVKLLSVLSGWYLFSIFGNNSTKEILTAAPIPLTLTLCQYICVIVYCGVIFKYMGIAPLPFSLNLIKLGIPLATGHILGSWLGKLSLEYVPVSFTHTVKATSPLFTMVISRIVLGTQFSLPLVLSVIPIIFGVSISSFTEIAFNFIGFLTAIGSTVLFTCQNIYSKVLFKGKSIDETNLLFIISVIGSAILLLPWFSIEFFTILDGQYRDPNVSLGKLTLLFIFNGFCHFAQNIMAFNALSMVTPLTYSVANTIKRVIVIIASIFYFGNIPSTLNAVGMILAIFGIFLYNRTEYNLAREYEVKEQSKNYPV